MARKKKVNNTEKQLALSMERTILSKERTILSFMQTGLAFIGVGIVIINVFPGSPPSLIIGTALVLIGFVEVLESMRRMVRYKKKMESVKKKLGKHMV